MYDVCVPFTGSRRKVSPTLRFAFVAFLRTQLWPCASLGPAQRGAVYKLNAKTRATAKSNNVAQLDRRLIKAIGNKDQKAIIKRKVRAIGVTTDSSDSAGTCRVCTADAVTTTRSLALDHIKDRAMVDGDTPTHPKISSSKTNNQIASVFLISCAEMGLLHSFHLSFIPFDCLLSGMISRVFLFFGGGGLDSSSK